MHKIGPLHVRSSEPIPSESVGIFQDLICNLIEVADFYGIQWPIQKTNVLQVFQWY